MKIWKELTLYKETFIALKNRLRMVINRKIKDTKLMIE